MKDWRLAIEHIGFERCSYTKLDHIHCMAFRKTIHRSDYTCVTNMSTNMYIPQDFNTSKMDVQQPASTDLGVSRLYTEGTLVTPTPAVADSELSTSGDAPSVTCDTEHKLLQSDSTHTPVSPLSDSATPVNNTGAVRSEIWRNGQSEISYNATNSDDESACKRAKLMQDNC